MRVQVPKDSMKEPGEAGLIREAEAQRRQEPPVSLRSGCAGKCLGWDAHQLPLSKAVSICSWPCEQ